MRTAIIVGAGIAGLASAKALADAGWQVEVLEEDADLRTLGTGFAITPNGMRAIDALGLGDAVREASSPQRTQGVRTSQGTQLQGPAEQTEVHGLHRATLHGILVDAATAAGVTITTGARVTGVDGAEVTIEEGHGVDASEAAEPAADVRSTASEDEADATADPAQADAAQSDAAQADAAHTDDPDADASADEVTVRTATADLVLAADGIESVLRHALWPKVVTDYSGATCWRGVVAARDDTPDGPLIWFGKGTEAGLVPIDGDRVYWYVASMARMGGSEDDEHLAAIERIGGYEQVLREHVAAEQESPVLRHDLNYLPTALRSYAKDGVVLVGDAAHAMLPTLGQGASAALEDAATLGVLARRDDIDAALVAYDLARRPRTQRLQRMSYRAFRNGIDVQAPLALAVRNAALNLVPGLVTEVAADWMLHWSPPED